MEGRRHASRRLNRLDLHFENRAQRIAKFDIAQHSINLLIVLIYAIDGIQRK